MKPILMLRLFVLVAALFASAEFASGNLITNPGFETGDFTGWMTTGAVSVNTLHPHSGTFAAEINNCFGSIGCGEIRQDFATIVGATYYFTAWSAFETGGTAKVMLNGLTQMSLSSGGFGPYMEDMFSFVATDTTSNVSIAGGGFFIDDISVTLVSVPVPEAGNSGLLLGLALAGLLFVPRRLSQVYRFA